MVDNVVANAGSGGATFATDFNASDGASGAHWPISKIAWGQRDTAYNIVDTASGAPLPIQLRSSAGTELATSSAPLQVSLANTAANSTAVKVDGSAVTQPVSGTLTANIGTTNGLALDATVAKLTLAQGSTTSGQDGALVQGAVTTAAPTYTTAQTSPLSLTTAGALRVDASATTQPISGTLSATQSGTWTVGFSFGAGVELIDSGGTNKASISSGGALKVDGSAVTQPVSGTVTANAGTGTLAVSAGALQLAQASTTSGQTGPLVQGAVTTGSPAYTTAQTSPLSLTTGGALRVDASATTQPVSGAVTANAGTGNFATNLAQVGGASTATGHGTASGSLRVELPTDGTGVVGLNAGSSLIGKVNPQPQTSGGLSAESLISAATTNATSVKASGGQVYSIYAHNTNASPRYLKLYNKASAPTVGTDTPFLRLPIPGNANGAGFVLNTDMGVAMGTGIAFAITAGVADSDTTAIAANEVVVNLFYA